MGDCVRGSVASAGKSILVYNQPPGQLSLATPVGKHSEYQPKGGD